MHSFLIALTYLAMIFAPCAVAQWGDILVMPRFFAFGRRKRSREAFAFAMQNGQTEHELADLVGAAFSAPAALPPFGTAPATLAAALEASTQRDAFVVAANRVAARLAQLVEARQRELAAFAENFATEIAVAAQGARPASEPMLSMETPSAVELDALYAFEEPVFAAVGHDTGEETERDAPTLRPLLEMPNAPPRFADEELQPTSIAA